MENFNKNWLAILLIAVVFGTLGFLLGRVTGHHHKGQGKEHREVKILKGEAGADSIQVKVAVTADGMMETTTTTDTITKDGKQIIIQEVKKIKK